jgi:hypothetical protein
MITMREIDQLRADADMVTEALRQIREDAHGCPDCEQGVASWCQQDIEDARVTKVCAEAAVVVALQQWWAQGCREVAP